MYLFFSQQTFCCESKIFPFKHFFLANIKLIIYFGEKSQKNYLSIAITLYYRILIIFSAEWGINSYRSNLILQWFDLNKLCGSTKIQNVFFMQQMCPIGIWIDKEITYVLLMTVNYRLLLCKKQCILWKRSTIFCILHTWNCILVLFVDFRNSIWSFILKIVNSTFLWLYKLRKHCNSASIWFVNQRDLIHSVTRD